MYILSKPHTETDLSAGFPSKGGSSATTKMNKKKTALLHPGVHPLYYEQLTPAVASVSYLYVYIYIYIYIHIYY